MNNTLPTPKELSSLGCVGVSEDSRDIKTNFIFFALKGSTSHGIDFIPHALEKGANFIVSEEPLPEHIECPQDVQTFVEPLARQLLASYTRHFSGNIPPHIIAVTGTDGKTSCALFITQILKILKHPAAYSGTLGFDYGRKPNTKFFHGFPPKPQEIPEPKQNTLTTERPLVLFKQLHKAHQKGSSHFVLEASSIGLEAHRLDALSFEAAAITSFGDDHVRDHGSIEAYRQSKMHLFRKLILPNAPVIAGPNLKEWMLQDNENFNLFSMDDPQPEFSYALVEENPKSIKVKVTLSSHEKETFSSHATWKHMPPFQRHNLLIAMQTVAAMKGFHPLDVIAASQHVCGILCRYEETISSHDHTKIIVDYAHNPHALEAVLKVAREQNPATLHVLFGAGGNRDVTRRLEMGKVAQLHADSIFITDDNSRNEDAALIREQIMESAGKKAQNIAGRRQAIKKAIQDLNPGDTLVVAGMGNDCHSSKDIISPWDDRSYVVEAWNQVHPDNPSPFHTPHILDFNTLVELFGPPVINPKNVYHPEGISINTRTLKAGDLFFALKGGSTDGHQFINHALQKDAAAVVCMNTQQICAPCEKAVFVVEDSLSALWKLAAYTRENKIKKAIGITGSVGKTSAKKAIDLVLSSQLNCFSTFGNLNNHFGLPLSISRTPFHTDVAAFEVGIDRPEEMPPMAELLAPDIALFTSFAPAHLKRLDSLEKIITAKMQLLSHMKDGAHVIIPTDCHELPQYKEFIESIISPYKNKFSFRFFGEASHATDRILSKTQNEHHLELELLINKQTIKTSLPAHGLHWAYTALATLVVHDILGQPLDVAARTLRLFSVEKGRGNITTLKDNNTTLIDHSYNASPASMLAALRTLSACRKHEGLCFAVLGDMNDLGEQALPYHQKVLSQATELKIDGVFVVGPLFTQALKESSLPPGQFVAHKGDLNLLADLLRSFLKPHDTLMIKGSRTLYLDTLISML